MEQDVASLGPDIKKYQETLAQDPGSYCFAPLAELYRKMGLVDEAIKTAKTGCELHPDYVGGLMALGRACFEKGMKEESRTALEKVVAITPDNLLALKLLSRVYIDRNDIPAAGNALRHVLSQDPGDTESQALLYSLSLSVEGGPATGEEWREMGDDEFDLEEADIIEDLTEEVTGDDLLDEEELSSEPQTGSAGEEEDVVGQTTTLISTATMAELYASQGFLKRALTIYREMLESEPNNAAWKKRLYELKKAIDEDTAMARGELQCVDEAMPEKTETTADDRSYITEAAMPAPAADGDSVVETLEKWLDTIRRRR